MAWRDRIRIGRTVSRGEPVADPREAMLAAAAARSQRRVIEAFPDAWVIHAGIGSILAVLALMTGEFLVLPMAALWLRARAGTAADASMHAWQERPPLSRRLGRP